MSELERQLTQLGRELDWPATPELAPAVSARRLAEPRARPRARGLPPAGFRRSLAIALAALLVLAGGVFAAVPDVRDSVLEFFGLRGATVERREQLPTAPELRPLRLGERTTLDAARDALGFEPLVPEAAGPPDGVYVDEGVPGGRLSLAYRARTGLPEARSTGLGLLVDEFRGDLSPEYGAKIAGQATRIEDSGSTATAPSGSRARRTSSSTAACRTSRSGRSACASRRTSSSWSRGACS